MPTEYETQILDIDVPTIVKKLRAIKAKEEPEVLQRRWVFDIQCLNAKKPGTGEWIRLRQSGKKTTLTYKNRVDTSIAGTHEIEVEVSDFEATAELLGKLKCFTGKYYQENKRRRWRLGKVEFTIDTWPMIPPLLEIESSSKVDVIKALKPLGLAGKDAGHIGTINIYRKYGIDLHSYPVLKFK